MRDAAGDNSELRLMELAARNPSLGGRELLMEIIERGPMPEENERPNSRDVRIALKARSLDDPDYRSPIEHTGWLGKESPMMRDLYEHGAEVKGDVLTIPAEEYELRDDRETPFITTLSYAQDRLGNIERGAEFYSLALAIGGETADARMRIAVFKHYYDRISHDNQGNRLGRDRESERSDALNRVLEEMRAVAGEMVKLETRESIETIETERIGASDFSFDRDAELMTGEMNVTARKVNLRDESLCFPAGLSYETRERLLSLTIPEIDRRLENGVSRRSLFEAVNNTMFRRDSPNLNDREMKERGRIAGFLKGYIDERLRDPETRALNTSAVFREARAAIINTTTPEAISHTAASILRSNLRRSEDLYRHRAAPERYPPPAVMPLNVRERNLLFNGRAPEHHTREMRDLRLNFGLSRRERHQRVADLRDGRIEPSDALRTILRELDSRWTAKAVAHLQASLLNETIEKSGSNHLYSLQQQLPPHESAFLFERSEEKKRIFAQPNREKITKEEGVHNGRGFGQAPRESRSFQEYLAEMGRIERKLLNEAVARQNPHSGRTEQSLSITEARSLLPQKARDEVRLRARNLAWNQLVPEELIERNPLPEALQLNETISHIHEHPQDRARIAQTARNEFVAEKLASTNRMKADRETIHESAERRTEIAGKVIESLSPQEAGKLAALEQYAIQTRENVYRAFEILDAQFRNLELARDYDVKPVQEIEVSRLEKVVRAETLRLTEAERAPTIFTNGQMTSSEQQHAATLDAQREGAVSTVNQSMPALRDQQWHFDSLREVLKREESSETHENPPERDNRALSFDLAHLDSIYER